MIYLLVMISKMTKNQLNPLSWIWLIFYCSYLECHNTYFSLFKKIKRSNRLITSQIEDKVLRSYTSGDFSCFEGV
jgi:hypothetical protein